MTRRTVPYPLWLVRTHGLVLARIARDLTAARPAVVMTSGIRLHVASHHEPVIDVVQFRVLLETWSVAPVADLIRTEGPDVEAGAPGEAAERVRAHRGVLPRGGCGRRHEQRGVTVGTANRHGNIGPG